MLFAKGCCTDAEVQQAMSRAWPQLNSGGLQSVAAVDPPWRAAVATHAGESTVSADLVVLVSGHPRWTNGDGLGTRHATVESVASAWRRGRAGALAGLSGNYALVILEPTTGRVHLLVDPFGLNSMFFAVEESRMLAATETEPILHLRERNLFDRAALQDVFAYRFLSGERTLWHGVRQVVPGFMVTIAPGGSVSEAEVRRVRFKPELTGLTMESAVTRTQSLLKSAFEARRDEGLTDVGIPLSGGVDSSIVAALAVRTFPRVHSYTASITGFDNPELPRAREVAERLGIPHRIVEVAEADVSRAYEPMIARIQEPPRHYNNLAIMRLMEEISRDCEWVASGDSADTLFGSGSLWTISNLARRRRIFDRSPAWFQSAAGRLLGSTLGARGRRAERLATRSLDELIREIDLVSRSDRAGRVMENLGLANRPSQELVSRHFETGDSPFETFQNWHLRIFSSVIYRRNERLARAHGLYLWYPFKEAPVADFAVGLPSNLKFGDGGLSKPILRELCGRVVGGDVGMWSKLGFPSPERQWMEGPLRAHLDACRTPGARIGALVDLDEVRRIPVSDQHHLLWALMTLETVLAQAPRSAIDD